MLAELTIRGLGVIDEARVDLGPGLTVVTGETGAGKTMVVTGLGLITGARADSGVVRHHTGHAQAEAVFTDVSPDVEKAVNESGGVIEAGELLITRQVTASGRSRAWLGGASVPLASLQNLDLVTIHGQSEQTRLSTPDRQREVLDRAAGGDMAAALEEYRALFEQRKAALSELAALTASSLERAREADMLRFGRSEIEKIGPSPGEDEDLVEEANRLQDADQLRANAFEALLALAGDDSMEDGQPALTSVSIARKALHAAAHTDHQAEALASLADEVASSVADLAGQVSTYLADLAADPVRLEWIETRLADLKRLTRKYGLNATEVLAWAKSADERLASIDGSDEHASELTERIGALETRLDEVALTMTTLRSGAATRFGAQVGKELAALAMPHAKVEFALSPLEDLGPWGRDQVQLLFTANPGSEPAPLGKVASGGELSRVRLAIEVVLADCGAGTTFVFDEVDAGIGGSVGLQVGLRLARLAQQSQVIVVTHLAQVAAFADHQWVVAKLSDGDVTSSCLVLVEGNERLAELARMMGGLDQTMSSLAHAQELVEQADLLITSSADTERD